jgi:hypothetical protein
MSSEEPRVSTSSAEQPRRARWKRIVLELLLWGAVAIATAVFLVYASERWLPANF